MASRKSKTEVMDAVVSGPARRSNWPDLPPAKDRRAIDFIAIDVDGETVAKAASRKIVKELIKEFKEYYKGSKVVARPVYLTESTLRQEDEKIRDDKRFYQSA